MKPNVNNIAFIGMSDALRPLYILEGVLRNDAFRNEYAGVKFYYITEKDSGRVVEFCLASEMEILVVDPGNMTLPNMDIDLLVAVGWSFKIPGNFLNLFSRGAMNCHGGILPEYRGANVYMHSYANIAEKYGVTIHYMDENLDAGDIILQTSAKLFLEETPLILHRRICEMTAWILPEAIRLVLEGYRGTKQSGTARYFYKIDRIKMEQIRQENINRLLNGEEKIIAEHKKISL